MYLVTSPSSLSVAHENQGWLQLMLSVKLLLSTVSLLATCTMTADDKNSQLKAFNCWKYFDKSSPQTLVKYFCPPATKIKSYLSSIVPAFSFVILATSIQVVYTWTRFNIVINGCSKIRLNKLTNMCWMTHSSI